ncbi:MAG: hypothetical protein JWR76_2642 [Mucilaginibacter sp.]|jgi:hypothetical protein|nr:hypothetical protein [Mucilaginibacter sp.]
MKKIYIAAAILIAVALTESCMKQRIAEKESGARKIRA